MLSWEPGFNAHSILPQVAPLASACCAPRKATGMGCDSQWSRLHSALTHLEPAELPLPALSSSRWSLSNCGPQPGCLLPHQWGVGKKPQSTWSHCALLASAYLERFAVGRRASWRAPRLPGSRAHSRVLPCLGWGQRGEQSHRKRGFTQHSRSGSSELPMGGSMSTDGDETPETGVGVTKDQGASSQRNLAGGPQCSHGPLVGMEI